MFKRISSTIGIFLIITVFGFIGCGKNNQQNNNQSEQMNQQETAPEITKAVAHLSGTKGHEKISGTVTFTKVDGGIKVVADVEGLKPGKHGFHIHENGDCGDDAKAAGGHFNPDGVKHAGPTDSVRHVGDMGNITADKSGKAHFEWTDNLMTFSGSHNIIGRAVIVHGNADDLKSQPSGNAGPRVACGVIKEE